ncbi:uncharacterized protein LOC132799352 [Ziziphus jujuba]|uniref:Uncharacterized protein LOC132799352 n=1 Tax=Ziziphus jujuba TaxID=326968 RepID=A0ABM3ZVC0_ZIZJJ|nr:uncharacterized protein LOC132799352 [Ziziphus jujuba]
MYRGLAEAILRGETDASSQGKRVILPSSFTGGARYMIQNYQDAMAICKWARYPELFITLTCSPKWPEVVHFVESRGLKPEDQLDILCRIFKVKLDQLVKDLRQNKIFGKVKADGYPIYRRRDNGRTIEKNGIALDNRYVVPHNHYLLLKYGSHMNVEWCNQSRSIKYLFKYVNKRHDQVTATFYGSANDSNVHGHMDEINMYYDCRYISPCEADWRIFDFDIHYRDPAVERLNFHLPNEKNIIFLDTDSIDAIMNQNTVSKSMFSALMDANKKYVEARELTYAEFPTRFVWKSSERAWHPRKHGFAIRRMFFVPLGCGNMYYLRILLNIVRGLRNFEEIMNRNGIQYNSLRDACYALGLLDDDKEYFDDLHLTDEEIKNYTLLEIEKILRSCGKSLRDFPMMHFLGTIDVSCCQNRLIQDELRYDRIALAEDHNKFVSNLTVE